MLLALTNQVVSPSPDMPGRSIQISAAGDGRSFTIWQAQCSNYSMNFQVIHFSEKSTD